MCVCVAAGMLWECVQCPQLTELDLKGCHLVELCDELQVRGTTEHTVEISRET